MYERISLLLLIFLASCSGLENSEREKVRRRNCKGEYIYRSQNEYYYPISPPTHTPRPPYPWESEVNLPRITKEYFRCKGNPLNPPLVDASDPDHPTPCADCDSRHGLPVIHGKENVYPILLDLLNFIQKRTGKRVVITCGHRCPLHNTYADLSKENKTSKHQIGAEVDFYVQGMEDRPLEIIGLLMQYYNETPLYKNQKDFLAFQRYEKADTGATVQPWMNKEIYIKLYQKSEGRDIDNRHPYPYISIQVRYDRDKKERVLYDWQKANLGYPRS
ncbi:MAG: hypothetical protein JSS32_08735 [Verrucomicrobia bacterium]|nr:hypothetical protein [Verrucomicrobiota bacterium]